jgi:hypothetical protein
MSFESFVLLSPSAFVIPTVITHLDTLSDTQDDLDNPTDLSFTHHLHLYAFPPFSEVKDPHAPPHTATHIATLDLPKFHVDFAAHIPPPHITIRTDPPPRYTLPTHEVTPWMPNPESGVAILEVYCHNPVGRDPHYVMICQKSTLIQYLPAPTSPLLLQAFPRPAPVVPWETLAPNMRMFDAEPACECLGWTPLNIAWVCYVYQNRYITRYGRNLRLYDFDPLRVRKEISEGMIGEDGIVLVAEESTTSGPALVDPITTGRNLPYTYVEKSSQGTSVALIDGERVVAIQVRCGVSPC